LVSGGQHGRRFVLLRHTGGHTPFVQAGAETPDNGAQAVKPAPGSAWEGHSRRVGTDLWNENAESCGVVRLLRIPLVIRPVRRTAGMGGGPNGCLDLRRRAFALDGLVSAEWSRCPGSMTLRARDSVPPLRRSSAGWMPARIGRLSAGVGRRHPVTIRKASLMAGSIRRV